MGVGKQKGDTMKVDLIVLDYVQDKVFIYRRIENPQKEGEINKFIEEHGHIAYEWMIREKIEIVELTDA